MLKIKVFIILLTLSILGFVFYSKTLNYKLNKFLIKNKVNVGIAIIKDNHLTVVNNKRYPLLSVFKYFVALKVLRYVDQQKFSLDTNVSINKNMLDFNTYSPMLKEYKNYPFNITISKLLEYMISQSDNNACDILIDYIGGIKEIENFVYELGYGAINIKVNEKDMNTNIYNQYLNTSFPKDIVLIMKMVKENNILSNSSFAFLENIMLKTETGENKVKAGLPENTKFFHKTGSGSRTSNGIKIADNDAGYVLLPNGDIYYIAILIKDSPLSDEENAKIISDISKIIYQHFSAHKNER